MSRVAILFAPTVFACAPHPSASSRATQCIELISSADIHGHLTAQSDGGTSRGGLENVGALVEAFRRHFGDRVLYVDSGDWMQGTLPSNLTRGEATIAGFNALRPSASTLGNHELDFDADDPLEHRVLAARMKQANFPVLACNVRDRRTRAPPAWLPVRESLLVTLGGVRIGLVGTATVDTPVTTFPGNVGNLEFVDPLECVTHQANRLREAGARFVVLLTHSGAVCTSPVECAPEGEVVNFLERLPRGTLDAVAAGHTHKKLSLTINEVPLAEPGVNGEALGWISLCGDGVVRHPVVEACRLDNRACAAPADAPWLGAREALPPSKALLEAVTPFLQRVATLQQEPIGVELSARLGRDDRRTSALGAVAAEAIRRTMRGADIGLINAGGLRADLPAGALRLRDLFEAFPFDNRVVLARMTPSQLETFVVTLWRRDGRMPQLVGAELVIDGSAASLRLPEPLRQRAEVNVATVDFLAFGGDGAPTLTDERHAKSLSAPGPLVRDAVFAYLRSRH